MKRFIAIALLLCSPAWSAWYNASWSHRAEVEIDAAYVDEAVPVIPVYLSGFDSTWHGAVQADGDDIIVTQSDGTTELDYCLFAYDAGSDIGLIMVNVDGYISTSTNVVLYVYAGNSGASAGSTSNTFTATGYVGVYAPGVGTTDYSGNGRTLTAINAPGATAAADYEVDAATYDGSTSYHYAGSSPVSGTATMSLEAIAYADNDTHLGTALAVARTSSNFPLGILSLDGVTGGNPARGLHRGDSPSISIAYTATGFSATTWTYIAESRNATSGSTIVYISGGNSGSNSTTITTATLDTVSIGALRSNGTISGYLDGSIVFSAISDSVRSADYIATMQDAWNTSAFRTYGATEAQPSGDTGYLEFTVAGTSAGGGTTNWTSASNALTSLATAATADVPDGDLSYRLELTDASAAITGLLDNVTQIDMEVIATGEDGGSQELIDENIQLIVGGSLYGADKSDAFNDWSDATQETRTYTWSPANGDTMPTPAQVDSSTFGISLQFNSNGGSQALMSVYRVRVRIYSAAPTSGSGFFGLVN